MRLRFAGLLTDGGIIIFSCCRRPTKASVGDDVHACGLSHVHQPYERKWACLAKAFLAIINWFDSQ
jgi:hypothetical protein